MPWTNIPNANLAAGAPIRSVDLIALRDNIPALANGDAGAPQIQTAGIANNAVTTAKLATNEQINTTNILNATAGATAGAVGTYMLAGANTQTNIGVNVTRAGSGLTSTYFSNGGNILASNQILAGTWRALQQDFSGSYGANQLSLLYLRIS